MGLYIRIRFLTCVFFAGQGAVELLLLKHFNGIEVYQSFPNFILDRIAKRRLQGGMERLWIALLHLQGSFFGLDALYRRLDGDLFRVFRICP